MLCTASKSLIDNDDISSSPSTPFIINTKPLVIIAESVDNNNNGRSYIGFHRESKQFYRPISHLGFGKQNAFSCYGNTNIKIFSTVKFSYVEHFATLHLTTYPHASEDFYVTSHFEEGDPCFDTYTQIEDVSYDHIREIFYPFGLKRLENKGFLVYVQHRTPCRSIGALKIKKKQLKVRRENDGSSHLLIKDEDRWYELPWTSVTSLNLYEIDEEEMVIVLVSFDRGCQIGTEVFCMLHAIGLLRESPNKSSVEVEVSIPFSPSLAFGIKTKSLIIIAKTECNNGHCYIGFCPERKRLYRPIARLHFGIKNACCWYQNANFEMYAMMNFSYLEQFTNTRLTTYPHATEDFFVRSEFDHGSPCFNVYEQIADVSKDHICDIFHPFGLKRLPYTGFQVYVLDGTPCKSTGALKIKKQKLKIRPEEDRRPRLFIQDEDKWYALPWTSVFPLNLDEIDEEEEVIVLVGFARGYEIDTEILCTLLAIGLIREPRNVCV